VLKSVLEHSFEGEIRDEQEKESEDFGKPGKQLNEV
jgi:hypothetical protein